jgi:uncharacterized lipoprotein NlpE involved in copper resistance
MKNLVALLVVAFVLTGCANRIALRDASTYKNEIAFLGMALEQDTDLLEEHLNDGTCSCDEQGQWNSEVCENTALNVLANLLEERPGDLPEVPEPSTLCKEIG